MHWRRKWQATPVFLPGESQGRGSLVSCCLWGRTESDTTENLAAAAPLRSTSHNFQVYNTVLLTIISRLYIRSPERIHLITRSLSSLTNPSPFPSPPPPGNQIEISLLVLSTRWFYFHFLGFIKKSNPFYKKRYFDVDCF